MKTFSFEYKEYKDAKGVLDEPDEAMVVEFSIENERVCTLSANREGLIALAKSLIRLADPRTFPPVNIFIYTTRFGWKKAPLS
jgi:hypothetical protein